MAPTESQGTAPLNKEAARQRVEDIRAQKAAWPREGETPKRRAPVVELTLHPDGSGYLATVQGVPDISSTGKTADEAVHNIMAALEASSYAGKYRTELP